MFNEAETLESSDSEERFSEKQKKNLTSLNISRANLSISQLNEILDFFQIEKLDCSCNDFSGIDDTFEIGNAKWVLKDANFSNCYISSPKFLREIFDCPCLAKVDLSKSNFGMSFYGFTVGSSTKSLQWLDISESHISNRFVMKLLDKFEKIEYLDLSNNDLNEYTGHNNAQNCSSFKPINAFQKKLSKSLRTVKISNCQLQINFALFYSFQSCENLEYLDVSKNNLKLYLSVFKDDACCRSTLKYLNISNCSFRDMNFFEFFTDMNALETLIFDGNDITYLNISYSKYTFEVTNNTSLKTISMCNCGQIKESVFRAIAQCKTLETLNCSGNDLRYFDLDNFDFGLARFSLRTIKMVECQINSKILLNAITDCTNLRELDLSCTTLSTTSHDLKFGASKDTLKILNLSYCSFSLRKTFHEITDCRKLQELYLSDNTFAFVFEEITFDAHRRL